MQSPKYLRLSLLCSMAFFLFLQSSQSPYMAPISMKMPRELRKAARAEYFLPLLRDPATGLIPENIRSQELAFASKLDRQNRNARRGGSPFEWTETGLTNVGGRSRALTYDSRNPDIVFAAGVSGGVWKSTDFGDSWALKSDISTGLAVTSITQDPTNLNQWVYAGGEERGSSNVHSTYFGQGLFTSTDNGETWNVSTYTETTDGTWQREATPNTSISTNWNTPFRYVAKVVFAPNGDLYLASNQYGLFRSTNDGQTFTKVFPNQTHDARYIEVEISTEGVIVVMLSTAVSGVFQNLSQAGIFRSNDQGQTWQNITPSDFPSEHERSLVAISASNPNMMYSLSFTGTTTTNADGNDFEVMAFYKYDLSDNSSENRSSNLPNYGGIVGFFDQSNYDLVLEVKPDDPDFVIAGAINLFRSFDGFATQPSKETAWIGGFSAQNNVSTYPNQHPDQHAFFFRPDNPQIAFSANDGGVFSTGNISANSGSINPVTWDNKNEGYNVTQYYAVAIPDQITDARYMGGTQDNGTPSVVAGTANTATSTDASSGDGAFCFYGQEVGFASGQFGGVRRLSYEANGGLDFRNAAEWAIIRPNTASTGRLFIHPYAVNPNDDNHIYYPIGDEIWRNLALKSIPNFTNGDATGWEVLTSADGSGAGMQTTAISTSKMPANIVYFAVSDVENGTATPQLYRIDNANASATTTNITPSGFPAGGYIHCIAVNPEDGNELMVVMTNYNITGLFHSSDAGASFTAVEGNLTGDASNPGPSLRWASIHTANDVKCYLVATSVGLYSTFGFSGNNTNWTKEGETTIGSAIVSGIASRTSDGVVVVGTHGRGAFRGAATGNLPTPELLIFTPTSALPKATVTIIGENLQVVTGVSFNGSNATFNIISRTEIQAIVPDNASTGPISLISPIGEVSSATDFVVQQAAVASVPSSISFGEVEITRSLEKPLWLKNIGNQPWVISNISYPEGFSSAVLNATIAANDSLEVAVAFQPQSLKEYTGAVTISSNANQGTVQVSVSGLAQIKQVRGLIDNFADGIATGWQANSGYTLTETGGVLQVQASNVGSNGEYFYIDFPELLNMTDHPTVAIAVSAAESRSFRIDLVDSEGHITNASPARKTLQATGIFESYVYDFTENFEQSSPASAVVNASEIASIRLYWNDGQSNASGSFSLDNVVVGAGDLDNNPSVAQPAPLFFAMEPNSGGVGAAIRLFGEYFRDTERVEFNGTEAQFKVESSNRLAVSVPNGATTGLIRITTATGNVNSPESFEVLSSNEVTLKSIAEVRNEPLGTEVAIIATATSANSIDPQLRFVEDASGGIGIRATSPNSSSIALNEEVFVSGKLGDENGTLVINVGTIWSSQGSADPVTPTVIGLGELGEKKEGHLVQIKALSFNESGDFAVGDFNINNGTITKTLRLAQSSNDLVGTAIPSGQVDITGIIVEDNGSYVVMPRGLADIVTGSVTGTPPVINAPGNQTMFSDGDALLLNFSISDEDTDLANVSVAAHSDNQNLLPNDSLTVSGAGGQLQLRVAPVAGLIGSANITLVASDGENVVEATFVLIVNQRVTGLNIADLSRFLKVYPNPVRDRLHLEMNYPKTGDWQLRLIDLSGRVMLAESLVKSTAIWETTFAMPHHIPSGAYLLQFISKEGIAQRLLMVE